jgi:predicted  nucleic acid-binding Zn-ribbon protein
MNSIGDLIDKLVIEDIKIYSIREKLNTQILDEKEYVDLNAKMMVLNENRSTIVSYLDDKLDKVLSKKEKNIIIKRLKTYGN